MYFCNLFDLFFHCDFHVFFFSRHCVATNCLFPPSNLVDIKAFWRVTFLDKLWRAWGWPIPNWLDCWNLTPQHYTFELVKFVVILMEFLPWVQQNFAAEPRSWQLCQLPTVRMLPHCEIVLQFLGNAEKFSTGIKTVPPEYIVLWGVS